MKIFHTELFERTEEQLDKTDINGCWLWTGSTSQNGEVELWAYLESGKRTSITLKRVVYEHTHGPQKNRQQYIHTCNNQLCGNPDHIVTSREYYASLPRVTEKKQVKRISVKKKYVKKTTPLKVINVRFINTNDEGKGNKSIARIKTNIKVRQLFDDLLTEINWDEHEDKRFNAIEITIRIGKHK